MDEPVAVNVPAVRMPDGRICVGLPEGLTEGNGVWMLDQDGVSYYRSTAHIREVCDELESDPDYDEQWTVAGWRMLAGMVDAWSP